MNTTRHYNKTYFSGVTPETCYWGGFLAADGCVSLKRNSVALRLAEKDIDHLQSFKDVVEHDGKLSYDVKTMSYGLQLYSAEQMLYDLENVFNIVPNKSLVLKPPYALAHHGIACEKAFLIGFIDGDGCIRYDNRDGLLHLDVFSGSSRMTAWAKRFIETEYGLPDKKIFASKNRRAFLYRLIGKSAETVRADLAGRVRFQLTRKWDSVLPELSPRVRLKESDADDFLVIGTDKGCGRVAGHMFFVCRAENGKLFNAKIIQDELNPYWLDPSLAIGRLLTVKYFGLTNKNGVPRFPVALRFRDDV